MVSGETRDYRGRHFCPRCGSWVIGRSGDEIEVNLGSFNLASLSQSDDQLIQQTRSWADVDSLPSFSVTGSCPGFADNRS